jgi:hypothetical protein
MATKQTAYQFYALMRKSMLLKWRKKLSTFWEIMLPALVILLLVAIRSAVSKDQIAASMFSF